MFFATLSACHFLKLKPTPSSARISQCTVFPELLTGIILVVGLIFVILHLNEIAVDSARVKAETDEGIDSSSLWNDLECPALFILELYQIPIILDDFVALVLRILEQLRQGKPLARHLVSIVRVNELVVIDAISSVALDAFNSRLAGIERNNVVLDWLAGTQ